MAPIIPTAAAGGVPLEYSVVDPSQGELDALIWRYFMPSFRKGYVRVGPHRALLPLYYLEHARAYHDMAVRDQDVYVVSHPKAGTTWTQEMAWCIANDLDFERAKVFLPERFPFLEHTTLFDYRDLFAKRPDMNFPLYVTNSVQYVSELPSPRFIKTHLPWELLPKQIQDGSKQPKIIYVARNCKDTCVSYYHHSKLLEGYKGSFDDFCKLFMGNSLTFAPFWSHVLSFWKRKDHSNILFLKYEDMKKDLPAVIRQTANFLGKSMTEDQVKTLANHLSFQNMKNNPAVNYEAVVEINRTFNLIEAEGQFMRSGQVGEWKATMTPELIKQFDSWTEKNLKGTDLTL
ncbi:hypothetical protein R5R35_011206 [Gryllus longicercus]|uniref:Sulfotransferase domain-containing protein n=1 Tax=Gryllus longicercus TaxID=2509291 RepID=A0AAN9VXX1_9ORTH